MNEQQNQQPSGGPPQAGGPQGGTMAVAPQPAAAPPPAAPAPRAVPNTRRIFLINGIGLLVLLAVAGLAYYFWHQSYYFYNTDDAAVTGTIANVAPPQPGSIIHVNYALGSTVSQGANIATLRAANGQTINAASPIAGTIIQEGATPGEVLPAGQPLAQVVDLNSLYVTAYVEETRINDVHTGQGVDVNIDAVSSTTFHGTVSRILPTAASALSAIPTTDYASGNFTKTTQRVPVQITLDGYQGHTLYPGLSASVTIHVHD